MMRSMRPPLWTRTRQKCFAAPVLNGQPGLPLVVFRHSCAAKIAGGRHEYRYAYHADDGRKSKSGHRRHDRQRARVVRFRRLRLFCHDDLAAFLPRRGQDHIVAEGLCRVRRRLRHAADRLDPVWHLWRSIWQTLGPERRHFPDGIFDPCDRAAADLRPSRRPGTHPAGDRQAVAGAVRRWRVGRVDLLYRGIRAGRTARFHRLLATGQRRLGFPAGLAQRRAHQLDAFVRSAAFLGVADSISARHSGRHPRGLSALAARRHPQVHRDRAARGSRQGAADRDRDQVSPGDPDDLRPHAAQHRGLLHTDHLHDQLHRVGCKASAILPTRVRYTALSIGYNIAVAVFGGFAPFIATWLIGVTGSNLAPAYYLIAAATITFLVVLRIRETAFEPLR